MRCRMAWILMTLVVTPFVAQAEIIPREAQRFCVDIAVLKGGVELRGTVLSRDEQELKLVIQRDWLQTHLPEMAQQLETEASKAHAAAQDELIRRIKVWQEERIEDVRLHAALRSEQNRLTKPAPKQPGSASQFVIVTIPFERVRRVFTAADLSRQLASVAWQQRLPKVEDTTQGTLKAAVEKQVPNWQTTSVDLSDRLPTGQRQSEEEWAARQAIYEYEYRLKLDFQGTGNLVFRVGEGAAPPAISELLAQTAGDALQSELGGLDLKGLGLEGLDLGSKPDQKSAATDWQQTAIAEARKLDCRGFRVTRLPKITGGGPVTLEIHFFARMADGNFRVIWFKQVTTDPASIKQNDLERVQQDPQVQQILKVAQAMSIGQDADQAVRVGAAVQASMGQAEDQFFAFRSRYNDTVDGPLLIVPSGQLSP